MDLSKLLNDGIGIEPFTLPEGENERLALPSDKPCPICKGPMFVGDDEYLGCCIKCYKED